MRLKKTISSLLREEVSKLLKEDKMTPNEAKSIFRKYGVNDVLSLTPEELKKVYRDIVKKLHTDRGGDDLSALQDLNRAKDVVDLHAKNGKATTNHNYYSRGETKAKGPSKTYTFGNGYGSRTFDIPDDEVWAWAGYSGGMGPSAQVYGTEDINYFKKKAWIISGKPPLETATAYTFHNFDGRFFRGVFTVFANEETLFEVSQMMVQWDNFNRSECVLVSERGSGVVRVVNVRGRKPKEEKVFHEEEYRDDDMFVGNMFNSNRFKRDLQQYLETV